MQPAPSPLPLLRIFTAVMALLAMFFAAQMAWHRHVLALPIEDRFADAEFQNQLLDGLQILSASVQPGASLEPQVICPPKGDQEPEIRRQAQFQCARAGLNAKLATANPPQHIPARISENSTQDNLLKSIQWLTRNARDGTHALALLRNPQQTASQNSMRDPFRLPGCLFANSDTATSLFDTKACDGRAVVSEADLPPHSQGLLYPLQRYRAAARSESPNTLQWEPTSGMKTVFTQGRHITAAWEAHSQSMAQTTASCYTGNAAACDACPWCNTKRGAAMFEAARARAIGILILDVRSGRIEAAASAYTPCYEARQLGELTAQDGCPLLPTPPGGKRVEPSFRLGNQALLQIAKPGSQVKIPIALGLMQAGLTPTEAAALPGILTRSATEEMIDLVLCRAHDFLPSCALQRLESIKKVSHDMGWQDKTDILSLGQIADLTSPQFAGRLLHLPMKYGDLRAIPILDQNTMRECGLKPVQVRWRNCRGADLVNVVAELFGQGNALTSPVGVANGLLQLAAAGNGDGTASMAHLVAAAQDSEGTTHEIQARQPLAFARESALPIFNGMSRTHTVGTAHSACVAAREAVKSGPWAIPCSDQTRSDTDQMRLRLITKTGTPGFDADKLSLPQWRDNCVQVAKELGGARQAQPRWYHLRNELAKCSLTPVKWYSMVVGAPDTTTWDKVIVVVAERNWYRTTERVDSAFDKVDANVAAEIGLALANSMYATPSKSNAFSMVIKHHPMKEQS